MATRSMARRRSRQRARWQAGGAPVRPAQPMPRFAALLVDGAVGYTVFVVVPSAWLPDRAVGFFLLTFLLWMVPWEAAWLRATGGTVGHWLTGIGLVWPRRRPGFRSLCWRTVKRYLLFWMIPGQPSAVAPGVLLVDTVRPISLARISRLIDGDGVVVARPWSVGRAAAVSTVCLAVPIAGIVVAVNLDPPPLCQDVYSDRALPRADAHRSNRSTAFEPVVTDYDCNPHELRNPLMGASIVWLAGAFVSVIGVADAWQHSESPQEGEDR